MTTRLLFFLALNLTLAGTLSAQVVLSTIAGNGSTGYTDGPALSATMNLPTGMVQTPNGDIYFCDILNHCIRKYEAATGTVSTFVGNGIAGYQDGTGTAAQLNIPFDIEIDPASGDFFISDSQNNMIRRATPAGVVTTVCGDLSLGFTDGTGAAARFRRPYSLEFLSTGEMIVVDRYNHAIRKVTTSGVVTTVAGTGTTGFIDGPALSAKFNNPLYLTVLPNDDVLITDRDNNRIRLLSGNTVSTFFGNGGSGFSDGPIGSAAMNEPHGIAYDLESDAVYFIDRVNAAIRVIKNGNVTTIAGNGSPGYSSNPSASCFYQPQQVYVSKESCGGLLITDQFNQRLRRITFDHFGTYPSLADTLCDTLQPADFTVQAPPYAGVTWGNGDSGDTLYNFSGTSMPVTIHYPGCDVLDTLNVTWISCGLAVDDFSNGASLGQNYPNPFSGNTSVPFVLSSRAQVKFEVWSVLGYKVLETDLGELNTGEHRVELNARDKNLPQGTYVYVLETSGSHGTSRTSRLMTVTR